LGEILGLKTSPHHDLEQPRGDPLDTGFKNYYLLLPGVVSLGSLEEG
jgi:hypothetical protein